MKRHLAMADPTLWILSAVLLATCSADETHPADPAKTSTEWRDDVANLEITKKFNQAYARLPFSVEYEGVLDERPFSIDWTVGPNLPVAWKGGVAGIIGDEIILTGGLWMPERLNVTYAYNTKTHTYRKLPPPPVRPAYTQGACDGQSLYVVGGRSAGRHVFKLAKDERGDWKWSELARLPESDAAGRWLAAVGLVPGKWLFVVGGHMTGTPSETEGTPRMPDFRLRLDKADAAWEPMPPYPAGDRDLIIPAVARGKLYVFGGSSCDRVMREIFKDIHDKYGVDVPYNGVPNYRDAFCYNSEKNQWNRIRNLPMPMVAGGTVTLDDRYVLLLGSADVRSRRVGKTTGRKDPYWLGYGDMVLCYDVQADNYCRVGVMPYGVATSPWVTDGRRIYCFGGEPAHEYIMNTENVLQIGTISAAK